MGPLVQKKKMKTLESDPVLYPVRIFSKIIGCALIELHTRRVTANPPPHTTPHHHTRLSLSLSPSGDLMMLVPNLAKATGKRV